MKSINVVSDKLFELNDRYAQIYPKFYQAELMYTIAKAEILMSQQIVGLGNQSLRDAEAERIMSQSDTYTTYHSLKPEIQVIDTQIKIYMQLSRNLNNMAWEETK